MMLHVITGLETNIKWLVAWTVIPQPWPAYGVSVSIGTKSLMELQDKVLHQLTHPITLQVAFYSLLCQPAVEGNGVTVSHLAQHRLNDSWIVVSTWLEGYRTLSNWTCFWISDLKPRFNHFYLLPKKRLLSILGLLRVYKGGPGKSFGMPSLTPTVT